MAKLRIYNHYR